MSNIASTAVSLASSVLSAVKDTQEARAQQKQTPQALVTSNSTTTSSSTSDKDVADRDTFLQLLVTQLKHQDPLAPQDGAQFVAQLAQFNSLDQLININSRLDQLIDKK